jgi:hypothetical protein
MHSYKAALLTTLIISPVGIERKQAEERVFEAEPAPAHQPQQ